MCRKPCHANWTATNITYALLITTAVTAAGSPSVKTASASTYTSSELMGSRLRVTSTVTAISARTAITEAVRNARRIRAGDASPAMPTTKTCKQAAIVMGGQPATLTACTTGGNEGHTQSE